MSIRVKVDEDLPRQVADLFSERGHDAVTVVMQGWQGFTDAALWPLVQQEERWLITAELVNDRQYLTASKMDLQKYHNALLNKVASHTKGGQERTFSLLYHRGEKAPTKDEA